MSREAMLGRTMVELADTLVDDFDVVELMTLLSDRCVEVLDVDAAGIMLATPGGELRVMASSSDAMRVLELFELQAEEGPCPDCHRTGKMVANGNLAEVGGRWPRFAPEAVAAGFRSAYAMPLRLRDTVLGALNLFRTDQGVMKRADLEAAQALADIASIAVLQQRIVQGAQLVNEQLQSALNSRIVIEQAKGMIGEQTGLEMEQAFALLRGHARNHGLRLSSLATDIIVGRMTAAALDVSVLQPAPASGKVRRQG